MEALSTFFIVLKKIIMVKKKDPKIEKHKATCFSGLLSDSFFFKRKLITFIGCHVFFQLHISVSHYFLKMLNPSLPACVPLQWYSCTLSDLNRPHRLWPMKN